MKRGNAIAGLVAALMVLTGGANAADLIRVANRGGAWDQIVPTLGVKAGFFKEAGIELEIFESDSSAAQMQAVTSKSADMAAVAISAFLPAAVKGVPIKIVSSQFLGASDLMWYVRSDSPIKSFKDLKPSNKVSFASNGSSTNITMLALLKLNGVTATPVAGGSDSAQLTQVMSHQIDVGSDTNGGMGVPEFQKGEVRVIASGADLSDFNHMTVRVLIANEDLVTKRRDVLKRYLQAYQKTVDWMYQDPKALEMAAEMMKSTPAEVKRVREAIYPKHAMNIGPVVGEALAIQQAVEFKRIDKPITVDQFNKLVDIVWTPDPK